jgi:hypothetical protein
MTALLFAVRRLWSLKQPYPANVCFYLIIAAGDMYIELEDYGFFLLLYGIP